MSGVPTWDSKTQPHIREWLVGLALGAPARCAIRAFIHYATDDELKSFYKSEDFWDKLRWRWLLASPGRERKTAASYLSRVRVGIGLSQGRGEQAW